MPSQLGADNWVSTKFSNGFFVDVGSADGEESNNSYELEKKGWTGICIDAFPRNSQTRTCIVETAVLGAFPDMELDFVKSKNTDLSGLNNTIFAHREKVFSEYHEIIRIKTRTLSDILEQHNAPSFIEYLSIDIEGAELDVIRTFPFHKYRFGCITVEHNYEEPRRAFIRFILESYGYKHEMEMHWDDWYTSSL